MCVFLRLPSQITTNSVTRNSTNSSSPGFGGQKPHTSGWAGPVPCGGCGTGTGALGFQVPLPCPVPAPHPSAEPCRSPFSDHRQGRASKFKGSCDQIGPPWESRTSSRPDSARRTLAPGSTLGCGGHVLRSRGAEVTVPPCRPDSRVTRYSVCAPNLWR